MNYWEQIRSYLQARISLESYENWLKGSSFVGLEGETLFVSVPDRETRTWLETEYSSLIKAGIQEMALPIRHVSYESEITKGKQNQALAAVENGHDIDSSANSLNPKFTFDSFVV